MVDEMPRSVLGKIQKNLLKQQYADVFKSRKGAL